ncbi:coiled-coil domain-containing protein, partial [Enterococcus faecalis]
AKANSTTESSLRKEVSDLKSENEELNKRVTELKNLIENSSTQDSSENNSDSASGNVKMGQAVEFTSGESITVTEVKADDSISLMDPVDG